MFVHGTEGSTGWTVVTEKGGDRTSQKFDFVVLASGSFTIPNYPDIKVSFSFAAYKAAQQLYSTSSQPN